MVTPKTKAKELYDAYIKALNITSDMRPDANPFAKECAMIATKEVISELENIEENITPHDFSRLLTYWDDVKKEIEAL